MTRADAMRLARLPMPACRRVLPVVLGALTLAPALAAGPYPPAAGKPGSDAITAADPRVAGWAVEVTELKRGPEEIDDPLSLPASYGTAASALGPPDVIGNSDQPPPESAAAKPAVSLGDGGSITLRFDPPITDGPGPDFAVFENGISFNGGASFFMELAFVEASSDGLQFIRFPAFSETSASAQIGAYGAVDPTNIRNLAGKYMAGFGTPFDLAELAGAPGLSTAAVTHLRLVDVVGSVDPRFASHDSLGRVINDPWPTFLTTSGFDLDAVGVIHRAGSYAAWRSAWTWSAADADPAADPDGDGTPNVLEYACGRSPLRAEPPPPLALTAAEGGWLVSLPPGIAIPPDIEMGVESSRDLIEWSFTPGLGPLSAGLAGEPQRYWRLRARLTRTP